MPDSMWLEIAKIGQGLLGTLLGGGLVLLGGWLSDQRKNRVEDEARGRRQRALLTGMYAVRNHIATRLSEWEEDSLLSRLEPLRTAQAYVHRMIDKTPGESEALMIAVIEIGLKLDTLIATIDRQAVESNSNALENLPQLVKLQVEELQVSLEQFDIIAGEELIFLSEDEVTKFADVSDAVPSKPQRPRQS